MKHFHHLLPLILVLGAGPIQGQPKPASLPAGTGLEAAYYNGTNFEQLVLRRRDAAIDFDWRKQPPASGLGSEYFSVRWEGYLLAPVSGEYEFSTVMDDGLRVWVGGKRIIDAWREQDHVPAVVRLRLEGGRYYRLRVDYFQSILDSRALLRWRLPDQPEPVPVSGRLLFAALPPSAKPASRAAAQPATTFAPAPVVQMKLPAGVTVTPTPNAVVVGRRPAPDARPRQTVAARPAPPPKTDITPVSSLAITPLVAPGPLPPAPIDSLPDLSSLAKGASVELKNLYFEQGKARLLPSSQPELNRLVRVLQAQVTLRFEIAGHTDNVGNAQLNQQLSEQRARVVRAHLIQRGIDSLRLTAIGYGGTRPVADNGDPRQRPRNRRVELVAR